MSTYKKALRYGILILTGLFSFSAQGQVNKQVNSQTKCNEKNILNQIVNINSFSNNYQGIEKVRRILIPEFEKLGFKARKYRIKTQVHDHIVTSLDFPDEKPSILLVGHLDTVFPPHAPPGKRGQEGDRIYGPGIIDMKGGLLVMLKTLENLSTNERKKIRIVLNDDEELASVYSREKLRELASGIPYGLVFEPGLPDGSLVTSSSGGRWIKLSIRGKAAHAGMEHELGLNACTELAHQLIELHAFTDYSKRVTLNVGVIEGGTQPNVVCEEASAKLDIRYVDERNLDEILKKIDEVAKKFHLRNAKLGLIPQSQLETLAVVPSMPESSTIMLFQMAKNVGYKLGKEVRGQHVGYATDGNHIVQTGISLLVGLGPYGGGLHSGQEFMKDGAIEERVSLSTGLIKEILKEVPFDKVDSTHCLDRRPSDQHDLQKSGELDPELFHKVTQTVEKEVAIPTSRFRIRSFSEVMFPSLKNGDRFVPRAGGKPFVPAFLSGQLGIDAEIIPNYRVFYLQKGLAIYPVNMQASMTGRLLDPRFGLRKTNIFEIPNLISEYDLFIQPGLAQAFIRQPGRIFDIGVRILNRYSLPSSQWTIGSNFEFVNTFFNQTNNAANFSGLMALYSSYRISSLFSTQHWVTSFYKHQREDPLLKFQWDITGAPYFQNGISFYTTKTSSVSLLLNQYAFELLNRSSMWISLWATMSYR